MSIYNQKAINDYSLTRVIDELNNIYETILKKLEVTI